MQGDRDNVYNHTMPVSSESMSLTPEPIGCDPATEEKVTQLHQGHAACQIPPIVRKLGPISHRHKVVRPDPLVVMIAS